MDDLLTTRQLQDLLQVDRITIYRMLSDGRLHGFKVGGQWRFSRQEIEAWLQRQRVSLEVSDGPAPAGDHASSPMRLLPLSCVQAIQGVCAEALDIAAVTTDLDGHPLTEISNSCDFCHLILSTEEGRRRCAVAWRSVQSGHIHPCHAGLLCVSARILVGGKPVAISAGCQFATPSAADGGQAWQAELPALAADLGLDQGELQAASHSVRLIPEDAVPRVSHLLKRVAHTFAEIGDERLHLLGRLQQIAEMSKI